MENKDFKYNYILYNMENGYKWQMYSELHNKDFIRMCRGALPMNEPILHKLHKLHWSARINEKIKLPFKKIWFKKMTNGKFKDNKPVCFILYGGQYAVRDSRLCDYIKKINPENKIALHYRDLIKSDAKYIDMLKEKVDIIYTYDKGEADKYNLVHYHSHIYSPLCEITQPETFDYDLYFIGYPKDRLDLIYKTYDAASSKGIRCCFKLVGVEPDKQKEGKGLLYLNKAIPYIQVVQDIQKAKCILEIVQKNSSGVTMRTLEALTYRRKLLTNRVIESNDELLTSAQMSMFDDIANIDLVFLRNPINYSKLKSVDTFSPFNELYFVENYFRNIKNR